MFSLTRGELDLVSSGPGRTELLWLICNGLLGSDSSSASVDIQPEQLQEREFAENAGLLNNIFSQRSCDVNAEFFTGGKHSSAPVVEGQRNAAGAWNWPHQVIQDVSHLFTPLCYWRVFATLTG